MSESRRCMGIDYGFRRIGISLSDPLGLTARPHTILNRKTNAADFARLREIIEHEQVTKLVIGLPTDSQGTIGRQGGRVISWAQKFAATINIPITFWDESHSSQQAAQIIRQGPDPDREHVDAVAAAVILQDYLDAGGADNEPGRPLHTLTTED